MSTGHDDPDATSKAFHETALGFAQRALHALPPGDRFISGTTGGVSEPTFARVREAVRLFVAEIYAILHEDEGPKTRVAHLEVAWFPLADGRTTEQPTPDDKYL